MECSEVRLKLDEYLNNRLENSIAQGIINHLDTCRNCREEMNMLREINDMLGRETPAFAGADFTSSVMNRIELLSLNERKFFLNKRPLVNLGASLVLTGFLIVFTNMPPINSAINKYTGNVVTSAQFINTSISSARMQVESYIKNILNTGGR